MSKPQPPIIVVKRKKIVQGGAHGGAWKVAYADFVTAMMAFFLLLWLLNTSDEQMRKGLAEQFAAFQFSKSTSGSGGLFYGRSVTTKSKSSQDKNTVSKQTTTPDYKAQSKSLYKSAYKMKTSLTIHGRGFFQFEITQDGLVIRLMDKKDKKLFHAGTHKATPALKEILRTIEKVIKPLENPIFISGHTSIIPFIGTDGETNWELSMLRANTVRILLHKLGLPNDKFTSISGRGWKVPLLRHDRLSPKNNRVEILLGWLKQHQKSII